MALTNAERQARHRAKQTGLEKSGGKERTRFSGYISWPAARRLKSLAAYHGISQGEVLDLALKALEGTTGKRS